MASQLSTRCRSSIRRDAHAARQAASSLTGTEARAVACNKPASQRVTEAAATRSMGRSDGEIRRGGGGCVSDRASHREAPARQQRLRVGSRCEHGQQRSRCKECGGGSVCEHGRRRHQCKECGGSGICEHGRVRRLCKVKGHESRMHRACARVTVSHPPGLMRLCLGLRFRRRRFPLGIVGRRD
jgi:hypothetical protein